MRAILNILIVLLTILLSVSFGKYVSKRNTVIDSFTEPVREDRMHPIFPNEPRKITDTNKLEHTNEFWINNGKKFVDEKSKAKLNKNVAKNIIFFMGDGMSIPTLAAVRSYMGGVEKKFSFEDFPSVGMAKTYCVDYQVADSACSATAYLSGVKGNEGTIGVNAKVPYGSCEAALDKSTHTTSIAKWAMDAGKWAGLVTTTRVTHASPAGVYANIAHRYWENDQDVLGDNCDPKVTDDIAKQLINSEVGSKLRVIMGGGRREFRNQTVRDEEGKPGKRIDGRDLISEWLSINKGIDRRSYVWNTTDLLNLDVSKTDYLLGLFENSHLNYRLDVVEKSREDKEPSLTEMVSKAIELLSKNEKGYFLFVEGGKIDIAHHDTHAHLSLDETVEFSKAIDYARRTVNEEDTIILVTADHAHTMSFAGYPKRGNNIFEPAGNSEKDKQPYMALSYANGLGFYSHVKPTGGREDLSKMDYNSNYFRFPATVPDEYESHGGDDVTVYVNGPWSHLFTGTYEQNVIPHILAYAACIGDGKTLCQKN